MVSAWKKHRIIAITGNLRGGKTLTLSQLAYNEWLKGQTIYTNYWLNFSKNKERIKFLDVKRRNRTNLETERLRTEYNKISDGFLAFDEIWSCADARKSISKENELVSEILLRSGHEGFNVAYTTQRLRQVDVRLREITNFIFSPRMLLNNKICLVRVYKVENGIGRGKITELPSYSFYSNRIFPLYNTRERLGEFTPSL